MVDVLRKIIAAKHLPDPYIHHFTQLHKVNQVNPTNPTKRIPTRPYLAAAGISSSSRFSSEISHVTRLSPGHHFNYKNLLIHSCVSSSRWCLAICQESLFKANILNCSCICILYSSNIVRTLICAQVEALTQTCKPGSIHPNSTLSTQLSQIKWLDFGIQNFQTTR